MSKKWDKICIKDKRFEGILGLGMQTHEDVRMRHHQHGVVMYILCCVRLLDQTEI